MEGRSHKLFIGALAVALATSTGLAITPQSADAQTGPVMCGGLEATIVADSDSYGPPIIGTDGDDVISGPRNGVNEIFGQGGDDVICGGSGYDIIFGGDGRDTIYGGGAWDFLFGGGQFDFGPDGKVNNLLPGAVFDDTAGNRLFGGADGDFLFGTNRWDYIQGGPDDDFIWGLGGRDRIYGNLGDDMIFGNGGADTLGGGPGNDTLYADAADITVRAGVGADACSAVQTRATTWLGCRIELETSSSFPLLPENPLPAELRGGPKDTWVIGSSGDERFLVLLDDEYFTHNGDHELSPVTTDFGFREWLHIEPLTHGQALSVAEAYCGNVIDPNAAYRADALRWGEQWLELHRHEVDFFASQYGADNC